jgi:hypothetical protein
MRRKLALMIGVPVIALAATVGGYRVATASGALNTAHQVHAAPTIVAACSGSHVWAVVNFDGTLARHSGACGGVSSSGSGGNYDVFFPKNIVNCAYVLTVGSAGRSGIVNPGYGTVVGAAGTTNGVFVQTFNASGTVVAEGFHLVVDC